MPDRSRVYAGFTTYERGANGGAAPSLIAQNQYSVAINMTIRGDYITTRPGWHSLVLTFADEMTWDRFDQGFQGAMWYDGQIGESGHLIARGGRLFKVTLGQQNLVTEITPRLFIVTTADFTVPNPGDTVVIEVVSESAIALGDTIFIDGEQYVVTARGANELTIEHVGGAGGATVVSGASLLDGDQMPIREWRENPSSLEFVDIIQAENYALVFSGQQKTIIYDGASSRLAGLDEVPPGVMGAYGWGRIWVCLPDRYTFVAGNLLDLTIGTNTILKFTENDYIVEGGSFGVPQSSGPITAMQFLALPDTSLGQGVLLVSTSNMVFTVNAPVDRTTWKTLQYPIQSIALLDYGPESPRATIRVNGDIHYRSQDGWRSFITAHRYFNKDRGGNVPISREITPLVDFDTMSLLFFGSAMLFDNKVMFTVSPFRHHNGISHRGLAVMNLDLLSDLGGSQPAAWEGAYSGLNTLQLVKARIEDNERGFAWVNPAYTGDRSNEIQLWEFSKDDYYDVSTTATTSTRTPIQGFFQTRSDDFQLPFDTKWLRMAELYVDEIVDNVSIKVSFRPDQYPVWTEWGTINFCANVTQCTFPTDCSVWAQQSTGYGARVTLGQPPETCTQTDAVVNRGKEFQWMLEGTGHFRIRKFRVHANYETSPQEGGHDPGSCEPVMCRTIKACQTNFFTYSAIPN